jgi:hypothetical protein
MAQIFGRNTFVKAGEETTYGTAAGVTVSTRCYSMSLACEQDRSRKTDLSTSNGAFSESFFDGFKNCGGGLTIPCLYEGAGIYLKAALGSVTSSAGPAPYTHTYKADTTDLPSLTIQAQRGSNGMEEFKGCKISQLTLNANAGEEVTMELEIISQDANARAGSITSSFGSGKQLFHYEATNPNTMVMTPSSGPAINLTLNSFTLVLNNAVERKNQLGSKLTAEPEVADFRSAVLSVECYLLDNNIYTNFLDGTTYDIEITFSETGSSNTFKVKLFGAPISNYSDNIDTVGRLMRTFDLTGYSDSSNEAIEIEVVNTQASGIAN